MAQRPDIPALSQTWVLNAQWTDLPQPIVEEVREMWLSYELGNDHCYTSWSHKEMSEDWPLISAYLEDKFPAGVPDLLIHWWW